MDGEMADDGVTPRRRVLLVFLDGVGIGRADPDVNPFLRRELPGLRGMLGGEVPTLDEPALRGTVRCRGGEELRVAALPLDATLGIDGVPQSGTGQAALLTGENAPRRFGRHFGPWLPVKLRPLVREENVLAAAGGAGLVPTFANAYPEDFDERRGHRLPAAMPYAAAAAGLMVRHAGALREGRAVASEIVNDGWRTHLGHDDLPRPTPEEAGENLARIAGEADLTLFAHYATDDAGHRQSMPAALEALERVDRFLVGVVRALPPGCTLVVGSDHGNLEDVGTSHTRNPALGLVAGPGVAGISPELASIADVRDVVLEWLLEERRAG